MLADEATDVLDPDLDKSAAERRKGASTYALADVTPVLVARSDGLAVYVSTDERLA